MASESINLKSNDSRLAARIVWSSTSNGSSANTSTVNAQLQARRTDSYTTKGTWTGSLTIAGTTESFSTSIGLSSEWFTFKTFPITQKHNDDGTGKCFISGNISAPSGTSMEGASASGSEEVTLDKIPRYLTITSFKVQSKTINTAVISWSTSDPRSSTHYSLNGGEWIGSATHGENVASDQKSGTFNIKNLSPNTTYKLKIDCIRSDSGLTTVSKEITFTTYDYAKLVNVPNVNIGSAHTITWTNPAGATTSLKLCKTDNSSIIDYGTVTGTSKSLTPTAATIYALTPNSNTYKARYILTTTQNSKTYTNYKDFTFTVTKSNPTFSNFTYKDTNATTVALTGNNQILVKGYSNVSATISTTNRAVAKNSATMKTYKLAIGNKSTNTKAYSSTADVTLDTINSINSGTLIAYATDSRGNSSSVTKNATYKQYSDLVIKSFTATRSNNGVGQEVTLNFNGTYWANSFGKVTNAITSVKYFYKVSSASSWQTGATTLTYSNSGGTFSGSISVQGDLGANGFDVSKSFNIRLQVTDKLVTKTYDITLGSGTPAIAIYKNNVAIGGKYNTSVGGALQLYGNTNMSQASGDTLYRAKRTDTGTEVRFGVGAGGINHGVWSQVLNKWILYADLSDIYLGEYNLNRFLKREGGTSDFNVWDKINTIRQYEEASSNKPSNLAKWGTVLTLIGSSYIQQLAIGNFNSKGSRIAIRSIVGDSATAWEYLELKPTSLYDNSSGSNGTITLSQTAANFSYLEIYFNDSVYKLNAYVKVYSPNDKIVALDVGHTFSSSGTRIVASRKVKISGTSISNASSDGDDYGVFNSWNNSIDKANKIGIIKVLGYK